MSRLGDRLRLHARDSFRPANDQPVTLAFADGTPRVVEESQHDVALDLDIAEFSSLLMGAIDLESLYLYGLAGGPCLPAGSCQR